MQIFNEGRYTPEIAGSESENENIPSREEFEKLHKMFKLATAALKVFITQKIYLLACLILHFKYYKSLMTLIINSAIIKSRDSELTEAIDEIAANPPSSEMQEVVKELEDEKEKLKKENKDLKNQIKKFKRAKSGQGAIEVNMIKLGFFNRKKIIL